MSMKPVLAILGTLTVASPAVAAQFYIIQDATTKKCSIVEQAPAANAGTIMGDGAYGDRASAEADMKATGACQEAQSDASSPSGTTPTPTR